MRFVARRPIGGSLKIAGFLFSILLVGLGLRLVWVPDKASGDILLIGRWCKFATLYGVEHVYDVERYAAFTRAEGVTGYLATPTIYPPFLIQLLALVGNLYRLLIHEFHVTAPAFQYAIRSPAFVADLVTVLIVFVLVRRFSQTRLALLAAAISAVNPVMAYTSSWAGHFDSVYSLFLLLAVIAAATRWPLLSGICFALALLTKLQAGALLPILAIAVWRLSGSPGLVKAGLGSLIAGLAVGASFLVSGTMPQVVDQVTDSFGFYPYLSVGAFNFWLLVTWAVSGKIPGLLPDNLPIGLGLTPRDFGLVALLVTTVLLAYLVWRRPTFERIVFASALQVFAFFLLATQMHERYIYPALPLLAVLLGRGLPTLLYTGLSLTFFVNFYVLFWSWQALGYALWQGGSIQMVVAAVNCLLFGLGLGSLLKDSGVVHHPGRSARMVVPPQALASEPTSPSIP